MSVARCREINARLRAAGITVHEWPGWETRGNGQPSAYEGGLIHHTATAFGSAPSVLVNGRSDLAGPLCNYAGNADGSLTVIAANPANHAGASGGKSMGPLPVTSSFNRRVLGLEIVYPGTVPMRDAQYRAALIWARVVADVVGFGDIQRIRAHAETSITGKWDPGDAPGRTINMAAFRAATSIRPEEDMTPDEHRILAELHEKLVSGWGEWSKAHLYKVLGDVKASSVDAANAAAARAQAVEAKVDAGLAALNSKVDSLAVAGVDVVQLAELLKPAVASAVADEVARRLAD